MRALPAMIGVAVLLAGCTSRVSAPAPSNRPLLFEVRKSGESFALFLNDAPAPPDRETWARILGRHATLVDTAAGFAGFDANGQSENPVVFRAPPDAPSQLFVQVLERMLESRIVKIQVELSRPGQAALHCELELPRDESLGPSRDYRLVLEGSGDAKKLTWQVWMAFRKKAVLGATGQPSTAEDWADKAVRRRLEALLRATQDITKGFEYHDAAVTWKPLPNPLAWGPVYEALAVIAELNAARRQTDAYATIISTWVYEEAVPPQPEAEAPPERPDTFPRPAPKDLKD